MAAISSPNSVPGFEDPTAISAYNIHTSSRYLDLTRRKLELTRLPREASLPDHRRWEHGTPKAVLEPLIDFWLEHYDWRAQETVLNASLPQFRTTISLGTSTTDTRSSSNPSHRVHFVHKRSTKRDAIPLLFCHGWPGSFLEVAKIVDLLTRETAAGQQVIEMDGRLDAIAEEQEQEREQERDQRETLAFHVVAPSIPGFGFSDPNPEERFGLRRTAEVFDTLMQRLGYREYVVFGSGWGFQLARTLALQHPLSCIALHTTTPGASIPPPSFGVSPTAWLKHQVAWTFGAKLPYFNFGYTPADFCSVTSPSVRANSAIYAVFSEKEAPNRIPSNRRRAMSLPLSNAVATHPQTLAFSLCDSPVGLLACVVDAIQSSSQHTHSNSSPRRSLHPVSTYSVTQEQGVREAVDDNSSEPFTPTDILNWTMLQWLPGPEAGLRWIRQVGRTKEEYLWRTWSSVPVGISAFRPINKSADTSFRNTECPMWAEGWMQLAWLRRRDIRVGAFPAWERPDEIAGDLRESVREVLNKRREEERKRNKKGPREVEQIVGDEAV